jgi:two-component sensor histidine kinase
MAAQPTGYSEHAALSLAMAVVASSPGPLLLLDSDLNIVAASASFAAAFELDPATVVGAPLASLGAGEWGVAQLQALLGAAAAGAAKVEAYEMDLKRQGQKTRRLVIHAQRLVYLDLENLRLLMAVFDVTDARADQREKDETLRRNVVLLQEVRHRVANSLQIIASVLLQNAKRTTSEETRGHLKDTFNRVMSVAELERQLTGAGDGLVDVGDYFTSLCASIETSMISDHDLVSLVVTGAGGVIQARMSVSLGLIVTELVINALKHAFPEGRHGAITVDFALHGPNWVLSVADNGVGMPTDPALIRTGLGTSIVQALAGQMQAAVEVESAYPGTRVAITHTQIALVDGLDEPDAEAPPAVEWPAA